MPGIDLHTHTLASDGTLSPTDLVRAAAQAGLEAIAVTDHDTLAGLAEAMEAGRRLGVEVVPGIEISTDYPLGKFHLLGYLLDLPAEPLAERLDRIQTSRATRNEQMVARLQELGLPITMEEAIEESGGGLLGRPHIARVLVHKGVVPDVAAAFHQYLADGKPGHIAKSRIPLERAIEVIHASGGLAVMAHPMQIGIDTETLAAELHRLAVIGLDGVECWYHNHPPELRHQLAALAAECGLAITGGSDFHGVTKPGVHLGDCGGGPAPAELLAGLKARKAG